MKALESAHKAETRELLNKWNSVIIPNIENEAALIEIELKKRHQNELEQFREQIEKECSHAAVL
jgi:vacuolar-type H+-ATPase subunit D/Vma8